MSDPITTVVTVISEHPQAAAAVASIYGVAKPFLAKILGPSVDEIGEIGRDYIKGRRAKNAERTLTDADKLLAAAGREPQAVPLDVAVPLLEAASLQEEPSMAEKWAALLANAADPAQRVAVQPGFAEVLRQLTPTDAQVLAAAAEIETNPESRSPYYTPIALLLPQFAPLTEQQLYVVTSNLARLGLCFNVGRQPIEASEVLAPNPRYNTMGPGVDFFRVTPFGFAFLAAVTPPTP